ncbi:DNA repair protein rad14 [Elsinoe australis]|uniref:DNA repair protein rad14 n=1 Tax=Elsinoe australis TaxID=40998 RepID=A0A2P7YFQ5_9PEZI|nr:DNA repair protein rad14 [Elsinoe australis]
MSLLPKIATTFAATYRTTFPTTIPCMSPFTSPPNDPAISPFAVSLTKSPPISPSASPDQVPDIPVPTSPGSPRRRERRRDKRKDSAADVMREGDPQNCHFGSSTGDKTREGLRGQVGDQDRKVEVVRRSGREYDRAEVMDGLDTVVTGGEAGGPRSRTVEEPYEMGREGDEVEEVEGEQGVDDEAQGDEGGRQIEHEAEGEAEGGADRSTWATLSGICQEETGKVGTCRVWEWLGNGETWLGVEDMVAKRRQGREGLAGTEEGELWLVCDERIEELEGEQRGRSRTRVIGG